MTEFDALLGKYLQLVLTNHMSGRWDAGVTQAELACVIHAARRQDPALMRRVRDAVEIMGGQLEGRATIH